MASGTIKEMLLLVRVHRAIMPMHHGCQIQTAVGGCRDSFRRCLLVLEDILRLSRHLRWLVIGVLILRLASGEPHVLWIDSPAVFAHGRLVWVGVEAKPTKRIGWCIILRKDCNVLTNLGSFCDGIAMAEAGQQESCPREVSPHLIWFVVAVLV